MPEILRRWRRSFAGAVGQAVTKIEPVIEPFRTCNRTQCPETSEMSETFQAISCLMAARVSAQIRANKGFSGKAERGLGIPYSIHLSYRGKNFRKPYPLRVYSDRGGYHYTDNLPDCPQKVAIAPV